MEDSEMIDDTKTMADGESERVTANEIDADEQEDMAATTTADVDEAEVLRKRGAMDNLGSIEKLFATFRDRLYDDRLTQLNNELAMLEGHKLDHPDLQAMLQCVDSRRDEKIQHEHIQLRYSLEALERTSIAERSQIHSEYFQSVRELRESHLDRIGQEFHEIQADRRKSESGIADYILHYPTDRTQQIHHQIAYNNEVSVLSGFAKYVGFPAAPTINPIPASEIELDLQRMGIKPALPLQPGTARTTVMPGAVNRKPAAEEQFLEQTPWANPQHPLHQRMQQMHRQIDDTAISTPSAGSKGKRKSPAGDSPGLADKQLSKSNPRQVSGPMKGRFSPKTVTNGDVSSKSVLEESAMAQNTDAITKSSSPTALHRVQGTPQTEAATNHHISNAPVPVTRLISSSDPSDSKTSPDSTSILGPQGPQSVIAGGAGRFG